MRSLHFSFLSLVLFACGNTDKSSFDENTDNGSILRDVDGDGYTSDEDCDDNNSFVYPGATENCDGVDNNCDGDRDEGVTVTSYLDTDGDGFGNINGILESCEIPEGYVPNGTDCDDTEENIFPSAPEICDGLDNNCNDEIDEGVTLTIYLDQDGDGYGTNENKQSCEVEDGWTNRPYDCDDMNNDGHNTDSQTVINPTLDMDCDGVVTLEDCDDADPTTVQDMDCDGVNSTAFGGDDCDDSFPNGNVLGSLANDNDCDGITSDLDCNDNDDDSTYVAIDADSVTGTSADHVSTQ